ncbi:fat storage-inducing transmembrane protein 2 [Aspergillus brasiliensis]|nr:fat storage-inducing transmembrane protein 2 [Aspergillus brasiliensis]
MPSPDPPAPAIRPFQPPITALLIYPATLIVGSLFSVLSPTAQSTRDDGSSTLHPHAEPLAPSIASDLNLSFPPPRPVNYFARKDNIFNLYFVKVGWLWTTAALAFILLSQPAYTLAASHRARRTGQAVLRYALATTVWYFTTQWFFGPPIVDRSFVLTGGKCERAVPLVENEPAAADAKTLFTAVACKHAGGAWTGGHDVSGHVFLLVLATSLVVFELVGGSQGWGKGSGVDSVNGSAEKEEKSEEVVDVVRVWSGRFAWAVAGLGWWMLLMTAIWFHTWFEKLTGLLIALGTVYTIYILPRRVLPWRNVVGLPGV